MAGGKARRMAAAKRGDVTKSAYANMSPSDKIEYKRSMLMKEGMAKRKKSQADHKKRMDYYDYKGTGQMKD